MKATMTSTDPDIRASLPALKRAAHSARRVARATGTPVYVLKNGRVVDLNARRPKRTKS